MHDQDRDIYDKMLKITSDSADIKLRMLPHAERQTVRKVRGEDYVTKTGKTIPRVLLLPVEDR